MLDESFAAVVALVRPTHGLSVRYYTCFSADVLVVGVNLQVTVEIALSPPYLRGLVGFLLNAHLAPEHL